MIMSNDVVVVPIKHFDAAKERLRLGNVPDVTSLARKLAAGVLTAATPRPVVVVSESREVSRFAEEYGAEFLESPNRGLNESVQWAYGVLNDRCDRLIVAHGDLRSPDKLGTFSFVEGVTFVADHLGQGTNVMALPTGLDFRFSYGPGSLQRHVQEAQRLELKYQVILDSPWRFDVDEASDLEDL
jgi:2-phospho-L-lactate guanylyltransferase